MTDYSAFVGLDVHKDTIAVAVADAGRTGEVRFWGEIANTPDAVASMLRKLGGRHSQIQFVYEAGPCGYSLHRQIMATQHHCEVVSPAQTPRKPWDRIKTDRRDSIILARLSRAAELTSVWVPDETHEAMRDLIRLRQAMVKDLRAARQRVKSFLLRHGRVFKGTSWKRSHRIWLGNQSFIIRRNRSHSRATLTPPIRPRRAVTQSMCRSGNLHRSGRWLRWWRRCRRGVAFVTAVTVVCEVGDIRRFAKPRQLMAFLGLVPGERSSGETRRQGGITKAGNVPARAALVEAAWSYRTPAKIGAQMMLRQEGIPQAAKEIGWKAQVRLCGRYRRLMARGKKSPLAITAVARELVGFIWAIAHTAEPAATAAA